MVAYLDSRSIEVLQFRVRRSGFRRVEVQYGSPINAVENNLTTPEAR